MDAPKTTIPVAEATDEQIRTIVDQVLLTVTLVSDGVDTGKLAPVLDRLFKEEEFRLWPLVGRAQPQYIQRLTERALAELDRPVTQEEGVAGAYIDSGTALPEVDQETGAAGPAEVVAEDPEPVAERVDMHGDAPDVHDAPEEG